MRFLRVTRKLRIEYPGAGYHVMNCGDRREAIFGDDRDRGIVPPFVEAQISVFFQSGRHAGAVAACLMQEPGRA